MIPDFQHFKDSVQDRYNGLIYKAGEVEALAERMLLILEDQELKSILGENNFQIYQATHTYEAAKEQLYDLISKVV